MADTETLGLGPRAVVTQLAFISWDLDDPEVILRQVEEYLPIQPQLTLSRTIRADTIIWWMDQPDEARAKFKQNSGDDFDELQALVSSVSRKLSQELEGADEVEIWAKGPQFDIVIIESLFDDLGQSVPWKYDQVQDLRTTMCNAGLKKTDVPFPAGLIKHHALSDCKYQLIQLTEARRKMHSRD